MELTPLTLFLLCNIFIMGIATALGVQHLIAHLRNHPEDSHPARPSAQKIALPRKLKNKLIESSEVHFQKVLDRTAVELEHDLGTTRHQLSKDLHNLGSKLISDEMGRYREKLLQLREQTEKALTSTQEEILQEQSALRTGIAEKRASLEQELEQRIAEEQQHLIDQIDTKISDAVASFLEETLQYNVDLGAQQSYLIKSLDEHKEDLKRSIRS